MLTQEVRPGLIIEWEGTEFIVLDKHPKPAHWWLQDKNTGEISVHWFVHASEMILRGDFTGQADIFTYMNRAGQEGAFIVRKELGEWIVTRSAEGWRVSHRPTSLRAIDVKTRKQADAIIKDLHENIAPAGKESNILIEQRRAISNILTAHMD